MEQTEPLGPQASPAERALLAPRGQKEIKEAREKKVTQGRTEWGIQASPGPLDPLDLWSTCQRRTAQWPVCQDPRAGRGTQAFLDLLGRRVTWAPKASGASRDPRVKRVNLAVSSVLMAELWPSPRKEPRESQASEDPRVHTDGLGTRERSASLDGRAALA